MKFKNLYPLMAAADDDGLDGPGGGADRGDDFAPDDDPEAAKAAVAGATDTDAADAAGADAAGADAAEDGKDKPQAKKGRGVIPVDRHERVLQRERERREALERELKQYQGGEQVAKTNQEIDTLETQIVGMEKDHSKLMADGEHEKAAELMSKIRKAERALNQRISDVKIAEAESRATERVRYDVALERLEAAYPQINPDHEDFDKDKLDEVADLKMAYEARGRTPTDAMQRAVKLILGAETSRQASATTVKPKVDAQEAGAEAAKAVAAERRKEAVARALDTKARTPADMGKIGRDSDKAGKVHQPSDVAKMSYGEFSKLDDKELARLRGDEVSA